VTLLFDDEHRMSGPVSVVWHSKTSFAGYPEQVSHRASAHPERNAKRVAGLDQIIHLGLDQLLDNAARLERAGLDRLLLLSAELFLLSYIGSHWTAAVTMPSVSPASAVAKETSAVAYGRITRPFATSAWSASPC